GIRDFHVTGVQTCALPISGDRRALEDYLDTVRELERRVKMAGSQDFSAYEVPDAPVGLMEDFAQQLKIMFDLLALAYQADMTREIGRASCRETGDSCEAAG